jgi:pyruvate/2-oxoglutarate dehydrogenase complex dihydrolipoamide acyltransferase (E2) component
MEFKQMDGSNENLKTQDFYISNNVLHEVVLRGSRKIVAERLKDSYQNKVHATMYRYMEIEKLKDYKEKAAKGSIIDHFIRAIALSLKEKPQLNSTFEDNIHRIYENVDICYAVNSKRGLVTPVLRKADSLTLNEFLVEKSRIINLVLEWKHEIADIMGGTFTITNMGNFGVDLTLPIINPPQVAILGISRICRMNISWDDKPPAPKLLMPVSFTYDHRVIDGVGVAEFAQILQNKINEPDTLWN